MYEDQPPFGADDKCKAAHFGSHPLGRSVLGSVGSITNLSVHDMRAYFQRRYSPGNIALVGAGRIDFDALVATAERVCGAWQPMEAPRATPPAAPHQSFQCLKKDSATLEYILQLTTGPGAKDDDRFAAKLLATVLGDDSGSRLYWELVDSGLAEQASLGHHDFQGAGVFMTYLSCDPQHAQENLARVARVYAEAERSGFGEQELAQAKSKVNSRVVLGSERPRGRLFTVGGNWLQRREYRTVQKDLESVDAVTVDALAKVLARYPLTVSTTLAIGPLESLRAAG